MAVMKDMFIRGLELLDEGLANANETENVLEENYYEGLLDMFKCLSPFEVKVDENGHHEIV